MNKSIQKFLILSFIASKIFAFNVSYNGNNPYESYQQHIPEERARFVKEDYIKYFPYYKKYDESKYVTNFALLNPYEIVLSQLPEPYSQMAGILPFNGWGMYFNYPFIIKLFEHNDIIDVVEIGSLLGLSTRHIASLLPKNGRLYSVDIWDYYQGMYEQFLSNVILTGLTEKIVPIRQRSDHIAQYFYQHQASFDLVYVDGDHSTEGVLADLELYYPLLRANKGIMCGDDWLLQSVRAAVLEFAQAYDLTIYAACNFWMLKKENGYACKSLIDVDSSIWNFGQK